MTTLRTVLRRLLGDDTRDAATERVHFHRRGEQPEPCYDEGCRIPRLTV